MGSQDIHLAVNPGRVNEGCASGVVGLWRMVTLKTIKLDKKY